LTKGQTYTQGTPVVTSNPNASQTGNQGSGYYPTTYNGLPPNSTCSQPVVAYHPIAAGTTNTLWDEKQMTKAEKKKLRQERKMAKKGLVGNAKLANTSNYSSYPTEKLLYKQQKYELRKAGLEREWNLCNMQLGGVQNILTARRVGSVNQQSFVPNPGQSTVVSGTNPVVYTTVQQAL